jgi:hypothetical protein
MARRISISFYYRSDMPNVSADPLGDDDGRSDCLNLGRHVKTGLSGGLSSRTIVRPLGKFDDCSN